MTERFFDALNRAAADHPIDSSIPNREKLQVLIIGSREGVIETIHNLHRRGFAEVGAWSPLLPTANLGEVMSILTRYLQR